MASYPEPRIYRPDRWSLTVSTAPAGEPVTLAEIKEALAIAVSDDDTLLTGLGVAVREMVEKSLNRALVTQTRVLRIGRFPYVDGQIIELPGGNIQSVTSIQYVDTDGATQTWASSNYVTDFLTDDGTGRVGLEYSKDWPSIREWGLPVTITYVAGWADDGASPPDYGANVPQAIQVAIKMIVADLYERREAATSMEFYHNDAVSALLSNWRIRTIYAA